MIQKCPNCGHWCETEGTGFLQRYGNGAGEVAEKAAHKFGGEDPGVLSTVLGAAVSSYHGIAKGLIKAVLGYKYEFHCPNCGEEWGTDDENDDETDEYLEEIEEVQDEFYSSVQTKIDECINANRPKDAIKYIDKLIKESDDKDDIAYLYRKQALINLNYLEDFDAALTACNRGLTLAEEEWSSADTLLYYYKYVAEENLGNIWAARRDALITYQHTEDEVINLGDDSSIPLEEVALDAFNRLDDEFAEKYLSLDYKERKAFLTVDSISDAGTTHVDVFTMSTLPSGISFPTGGGGGF